MKNFLLDMFDENKYYFSNFNEAWQKTDKGYIVSCKTSGVNPEDINVTVENDKIIVTGKTECKGWEYAANYAIDIKEDIFEEIVTIGYKTLNGITYIYIETEKPKKKEIKVKKI